MTTTGRSVEPAPGRSRRWRSGVGMAALAAAALLPAPAAPGDEGPECHPPPVAGAGVPTAEAVRLECGQALACWRRRLAAAAAQARAEGADFFTARGYQELVEGARFLLRAGPDAARVAAMAADLRSFAARHPGDAGSAFLLALLAGDRAAKIAALAAVAAAHPDFPWTHLELAKLRARTGEPGAAAAATGHLERFVALCPVARADVLEVLHRLGDSDLWARLGPPLRAAAERQLAETGDPRPFSWLWRSEFRFSPVEEHEAVRRRVAADVARLREAVRPADLEGWYTLDEGFELLGDAAGRAWVDDQVLAHLPCSLPAPFVRRDRFEKDHPPPAEGDEAAERAYQRALFAATGEWTRACPGDGRSWGMRLGAIRRLHALGDPAAQGEVEATAAAILDRVAAEELSAPGFPSLPAEIATTWLALGLHLDRVPELVERDRAAVEADAALQRAWAAERENPTPEGEASLALREHRHRLENRDLAVRGFLALGRLDPARAALAELEALLDGLGELSDERAGASREPFAGRLRRRRAELAEREGRRLDAVALYRAAAASDPGAAAEARRLWRELGGTAEGWATLAGAAGDEAAGAAAATTAAGGWRPVEAGEPLPAFAAPDLAGELWRSADLPGRVAFVNLWATWCPPCRKELPLVEELHRRFAGSDEVLVVTLNVDDNPGLVEPYVAREGWTFPVVLVGPHYAGHDMGVGIPRSWILDRAGRAVWTEVGFQGDPEWAERTRALLAAVVAGKE